MTEHFTLNHFADYGLELFILSSAWNGPHWPRTALGGLPVAWLNSDDPINRRFAFVLNASNGAVYSNGGLSLGIGMPWWVMVDCALMPAGFFGVMGPAKLLQPEKRKMIDTILANIPLPLGVDDKSLTAPLADDEIIPLSEASTLPCAMPEKITSYSLYSLVPGLAVIAKSLSLSAYRQMGRKWQMGIAQFDNKSLRIHTGFGLLEILNFSVPLHTFSQKTMYYRLDIPDDDALLRYSRGEKLTHDLPGDVRQISVTDVRTRAEFESRRAAGTHRYYLASPGLSDDRQYNPIVEVKI
jgi:hypothetical protein